MCAACHGLNGVSIADAIPNLAGQRAAYIEAQLKAFKAGTRKAPSMNAIAGQLAPQRRVLAPGEDGIPRPQRVQLLDRHLLDRAASHGDGGAAFVQVEQSEKAGIRA